jgi:hypothetical protein
VLLALCAGLVTGMLTAVRQGLSGANMKLCVVRINLADDAAEPVAKPEEGEFIEKHLVPLKQLYRTLKGASFARSPADLLHALPLLTRHSSQTLRRRATPSTPDWHILPSALSWRRRRACSRSRLAS